MDRKELIEKAREHSKYDVPADTQCLLLQMAAELEKDRGQENMVSCADIKAACYDVITEGFAELVSLADPEQDIVNFMDGVIKTEDAVMKMLFEKKALDVWNDDSDIWSDE